MKTIFISYVFEDKATLSAVLNWKNQGLNPNITFISEEKDLRQSGEPAVEAYLKSLMDKSDAVLILIGDDTHNRRWVIWEYNYAQNKKLKYEVFRIPNTSGAVPPIIGRDTMKLTLSNLHSTLEKWGW